jgi:hypothetical protein
MSPNTHAILSELHKLLSTYTAKDFRDARDYSGLSRSMRAALDALCREAIPKNESAGPRQHRIDSQPSNLRRSVGGASGLDIKSDILSVIRHSPYYDSVHGLLNFARVAGVRLESHPKESRDRVARRLAASILLLPAAKKDEVISILRSRMKSQTEGWIDVIRKTANE